MLIVIDKISSVLWHLSSNVEDITRFVRRASYTIKNKRDFYAQCVSGIGMHTANTLIIYKQ